MSNKDFHNYLMADVLSRFPGVSSRAMFGGYGVYRDGLFFAIIDDERLYFKVDEVNRPDFEKIGSRPFTYPGPGGKPMEMSYFEVPERIYEDGEELERWMLAAVAVADRKKRRK